jgi:hypothetical protein
MEGESHRRTLHPQLLIAMMIQSAHLIMHDLNFEDRLSIVVKHDSLTQACSAQAS